MLGNNTSNIFQNQLEDHFVFKSVFRFLIESPFCSTHDDFLLLLLRVWATHLIMFLADLIMSKEWFCRKRLRTVICSERTPLCCLQMWLLIQCYAICFKHMVTQQSAGSHQISLQLISISAANDTVQPPGSVCFKYQNIERKTTGSAWETWSLSNMFL